MLKRLFFIGTLITIVVLLFFSSFSHQEKLLERHFQAQAALEPGIPPNLNFQNVTGVQVGRLPALQDTPLEIEPLEAIQSN